MGEVTFQLPPAPPEDYLRLVRWWREGTRFMVSAVTLGASRPGVRGRDPVRDLVEFDAPELVEAQARRALDEGAPEIAPTLRVDGARAARARVEVKRRMAWLQDMAGRGGPPMDPGIEPLAAAAQAAGDEALRAAGFDLDRSASQ